MPLSTAFRGLVPSSLQQLSHQAGLHRCRFPSQSRSLSRPLRTHKPLHIHPRLAVCNSETGGTSHKIMTSITAEPQQTDIKEFEVALHRHDFKIVKEELVFSRYLNVYNRVVEYPPDPSTSGNGAHRKVIPYDVVGAKTVTSHFCAVLPYDTQKKLFTVVREYSQGANHLVYGVPAGGLTEAHGTKEECARAELSEEVHLRGGELVRLLDPDHPGLLEIKWCKNRFTPFLVLDAQPDQSPGLKDHEEFIEVVTMDLAKLKHTMYSGDMMLPSIVTCAMALEHLKARNLI